MDGESTYGKATDLISTAPATRPVIWPETNSPQLIAFNTQLATKREPNGTQNPHDSIHLSV